jgi:hypothetical protein
MIPISGLYYFSDDNLTASYQRLAISAPSIFIAGILQWKIKFETLQFWIDNRFLIYSESLKIKSVRLRDNWLSSSLVGVSGYDFDIDIISRLSACIILIFLLLRRITVVKIVRKHGLRRQLHIFVFVYVSHLVYHESKASWSRATIK